ncbi:MAG: DUF432 domain-containing protein [Trueperaceae bacterium]
MSDVPQEPDAPEEAGGPHLENVEVPVVDPPPEPTSAEPLDPRWWGEVTLAPGGVARLRAGPSTVHVERRTSDWRVWHEGGADAYAVVAERVHALDDGAPEGKPTLRFSFAESPDTLHVRPRLADRPVVVRPETPLVVPPGETVTLYASTPVWMAIKFEVRRTRRGRAHATDLAVVAELPTARPTDTWYGPNTREGELCYAVRTAARTEVADLPLRPHRAVTAVTVENQAATPLALVRIAVPMPFLALHVDPDGRLWTDRVRFVHQSDGDTTVEAQPAAPTGGTLLAEPRDAPTLTQTLSRTVSRLFKVDVR